MYFIYIICLGKKRPMAQFDGLGSLELHIKENSNAGEILPIEYLCRYDK